MSWVDTNLGEHIDLISGPAFKSAQFTEDNEDVPLIKGENIAQGYIAWEKSKYWPRSELNEYKKYWLEQGDLVLAMDRPWIPAGLKWAEIQSHDRLCLLVQRVARIRATENLHQRFLKYLIASKGFSDYIQNIMYGTNVPHISGKQIKAFSFLLPDLPTQERTAAILSAYDDLIENNRRRIALLEQAARLLYREWFVHFRFPGHEVAKFEGGLPEGWDVKQVKDLLLRVKAKPKIRKDKYEQVGSFPCVDQGQSFVGGFTNNNEAIYRDELPLIVFGDHTRALKYVDFPFARGADGTQIIKSSDGRLSQVQFYFALINVDLSNYAYARHFKFLKDQEIILPDEETGSEFTTIAQTSFIQMQNLRDQNAQLTAARDLLLPRLMDGRIPV